MCPHGYHHSGSMATPALGTRDIYIYRFPSRKLSLSLSVVASSLSSSSSSLSYHKSLCFGVCVTVSLMTRDKEQKFQICDEFTETSGVFSLSLFLFYLFIYFFYFILFYFFLQLLVLTVAYVRV